MLNRKPEDYLSILFKTIICINQKIETSEFAKNLACMPLLWSFSSAVYEGSSRDEAECSQSWEYVWKSAAKSSLRIHTFFGDRLKMDLYMD